MWSAFIKGIQLFSGERLLTSPAERLVECIIPLMEWVKRIEELLERAAAKQPEILAMSLIGC